METGIEPFIETLFRPLSRGRVDVPAEGRLLYANARPAAPDLLALLPEARRVCWQPRRSMALSMSLYDSKPLGEPLDFGFPDLAELSAGATLALVPLTRQRDRSMAIAATVWEGLADGGTLVAAAPNTGGARGYERAFEDAIGGVTSMSKNKARVFWAKKRADRGANWQAASDICEIEGGWQTRPGVFSWEHPDPASLLLAEVLEGEEEPDGLVFDLGAGWGFLSGRLIRHGWERGRFTLLEDDIEALELASRNAPGAAYRWADVTRETAPRVADMIIMNPPFHRGHQTDVDLGLAFFDAARKALRPRGVVWAVANLHLPYEAHGRELFETFEVTVERDGFKVLRGSRPR